ncbi:MAG TPA: hypothetical protein VNX01_10485 [Bacteroidia bacterium]|nr:hypothetical protein [Bacteroidia bacterium]
MNQTDQIDELFLTGADCFILALEKHNQLQGAVGNTCRYVLELKGKLDAEAFKRKINQDTIIQQLAALSVAKIGLLSKPKWQLNQIKEIEVTVHESDAFIPDAVLQRQFIIDKPCLFSFDIVNRTNGNSCLILSWHHLLMDGYGAVLLLKKINGNEEITLSAEEPKIKFNFKNIQQAAKAKFFIDKTSKKELSSIGSTLEYISVNQKIKVIQFTEEETKQIESNASVLGAKFGLSPFYLACSARGVKQILYERKKTVTNFWVPVPQNTRKKGTLGPLLSNHISFLFYRIANAELSSLKECVGLLNNQMVNQMRNGLPKAYNKLQNFLKRVPSPLYYQLIKGPQGKSLASFLFTVAEEHPQELLEFEGLKVLSALSLPPNNFKPGLTFAFMRFNNCLQIMLLYFDEVISEKEMTTLEKQLKYELITGQDLL